MENEHNCGKGWAERCRMAKSKTCRCSCGGHNHGKGVMTLFGPVKPERKGEQQEIVRERSQENLLIVGYPRSHGHPKVLIGNREIEPDLSLSFRNHSPDGFSWGYGGSGPAQLALAILIELIGSEKALSLYQQFKWEIIAKLEQDKSFSFPASDVYAWIDKKLSTTEPLRSIKK